MREKCITSSCPSLVTRYPLYLMSVIPNRDATKKYQGCRQISNYCILIDVLLHMMPHIVIYNQLGVPEIFCKDLKGAAKQKRLKNTALCTTT